jgi:hypothetical protein
VLNFENVPSLRSDDLEGLLPTTPNDLPSPIRVLNLARTSVDDDATIYIAACNDLEVLNVSGTKIGREWIAMWRAMLRFNLEFNLDIGDALFTILDSCPNVRELDLTGCRSISVLNRRRFFEVRTK